MCALLTRSTSRHREKFSFVLGLWWFHSSACTVCTYQVYVPGSASIRISGDLFLLNMAKQDFFRILLIMAQTDKALLPTGSVTNSLAVTLFARACLCVCLCGCRSMLQASSDDNSSSELDAGHAKQLLHLPKLQNLALETTYGAVAPVRLDWLHGAKQLRHLAAYVDPTAPVPGAASVSQLQSLTCR